MSSLPIALSRIFNVYCDESCHLEKDQQPIMVIGALWCPLERSREIAVRIREIKQRHGLPPHFEIKWSKVSPSKQQFYLDLLDYFFDTSDLHFRCLIAPKTSLRHSAFDQTHDTWYYKMYFLALQNIFQPNSAYRIYVDIKDTRSGEKLATLHEVLCNNIYDFRRKVVPRVQAIHSHEVEQGQLADLLVGIVSYANRHAPGSAAKAALVQRAQQRTGHDLQRSTLLREDKFNVFRWQPYSPAEGEV